MRLKRDSKRDLIETQMLKWDSNGAHFGLKLDSNGIQMGLKWDSNGTQMGLKWDMRWIVHEEFQMQVQGKSAIQILESVYSQ